VEEALIKDWIDLKSVPSVVYNVKDVNVLAPISNPKKNIICLGLNYFDHMQEVKIPIQEYPIFFTKPPTSIIGPYDRILLPKCSNEIDYEAELAFVLENEEKTF